ncbi:hypothetical protein [Hymenobacter lapidiphilus]|uniref:Uncharacterized protein n=1 Tax=Hymenobacter lapidiphilus TaxID=2608003 RepID=A0A7Y7PMX3_9BACT|nr:hypothetical protein [Hymenobacter lapidiphilus]NVO30743.1 hypothetical protein [Hymenobacter lapidiphilus]
MPLPLLLALTLQQATTLPPDTTRLRQQLPDVAVRATRRVLALRAPGETKGLQTAFGRELTPTAAVAVWHGPPDSSRVYVVRAVRVRLGSRPPTAAKDVPKVRRNFSEGAIRLWLSPGSQTGGPQPAQNLLAAPLLLTANTTAKKGWVRFDVMQQRLVLPARGLFVVAEGETTGSETYVKQRSLARPLNGKNLPEDIDFQKAKPKKGHKGVETFRCVELRRADGSSRLALTNAFPTLAYRQVPAPANSQSWIRRIRQPDKTVFWRSVPQDLAPLRKAFPEVSAPDYNYELELEVEEL